MKTWIVVLLAFVAAGRAGAAVVYLKDGGRLEGTILRQDGEGVELRTAQGPVAISADKILRVEGEKPRRRRISQDELFEPRRQIFSFDVGFNVPLNRIDFSEIGGGSANNGDVGPLVGAQYLYSLSPRLALGGEFHYAYRSGTDSPTLLRNSDASVSGDSLLFLGIVKYSLTDRGWARPYLLGGAGAHRSSVVIDAQPNLGFVWNDTGTDEVRRLVDDDAWGGALSARFGVDFGGDDPFVFSLEGGWTGVMSAHYAATAQGKDVGLSSVSGPINMLTFALRTGWRF